MRKKRIPQRKCIVTNEMKPKKDMIRVVRTKEGEVFVDPTGKKNGRGAYLSKDIAIIEQAKSTGVLNRHLNTEVDSTIFDELIKLVEKNEQT